MIAVSTVVDGRERHREAGARRLVDAPNRFARLGDRVDEVLPLRRQERVPRLELVVLLDGHHVDGTEAVDLGGSGRSVSMLGELRVGHLGHLRLRCEPSRAARQSRRTGRTTQTQTTFGQLMERSH